MSTTNTEIMEIYREEKKIQIEENGGCEEAIAERINQLGQSGTKQEV